MLGEKVQDMGMLQELIWDQMWCIQGVGLKTINKRGFHNLAAPPTCSSCITHLDSTETAELNRLCAEMWNVSLCVLGGEQLNPRGRGAGIQCEEPVQLQVASFCSQ